MTTRNKWRAAFLQTLLACLPLAARAAQPTWGKVDAMTQALNTQMCLSCNYDGSSKAGEAEAVVLASGWGAKKNAALDVKPSLIRKVWNHVKVPKPEYGPLEDRPKEDKPDLNRWNPAIEGANGAVYFGLIGMIFGGPVGMILGAAIGFLMMYYGRIHNDRG